MAYARFPELSRLPALKGKDKLAVDPTLRDTLENGMESTRARFTRMRNQYTVTIEHLTNDDKRLLLEFRDVTVGCGALMFFFRDTRDPRNPRDLLVRFSVVPEFEDEGWVQDQQRYKTTFELREV